jgi:hypothetical protein
MLQKNPEPIIEILKQNQDLVKGQHGGARPGAGRPKLEMTPAGIERREVKKAFEDRVARNADKLFNVQFNLARGEQYLMCKSTTGHGKNRRTEVDIITDPELIKAYINGDIENDEDEFYFISTKPANGQAIDSMLDRAFGKAPQKLEMEHSGNIGSSAYDASKQAEFEAWLENQS